MIYIDRLSDLISKNRNDGQKFRNVILYIWNILQFAIISSTFWSNEKCYYWPIWWGDVVAGFVDLSMSNWAVCLACILYICMWCWSCLLGYVAPQSLYRIYEFRPLCQYENPVCIYSSTPLNIILHTFAASFCTQSLNNLPFTPNKANVCFFN